MSDSTRQPQLLPQKQSYGVVLLVHHAKPRTFDFSGWGGNPEALFGEFKEYTSKKVVKCIVGHPQESRREWLLDLFKKAAKESTNVKRRQFLQHHNKPIELWSSDVIDQKIEYIHNNPVVAGFVVDPWHWP